jgi:predicted XRE-type DNA-binding protein
MTGRNKFETLKQKMGSSRIRDVEARTKTMIGEMLLSEIRKRSGMTQQEVADALGISQPGLSKMEQQEDIQVSTLGKLIEAMGGRMEIVAHFPFGDCKLTQFDDQASAP